MKNDISQLEIIKKKNGHLPGSHLLFANTTMHRIECLGFLKFFFFCFHTIDIEQEKKHEEIKIT